MINVFKNRTRLCALTTSALFFLQSVDPSVAWISFLPSLPSIRIPSILNFGSSSPKESGERGDETEERGESLPQAEKVVGVPSQDNPSMDIVSNPFSLSGGLVFSNQCNIEGGSGITGDHEPISCEDGERHEVKNGSIRIKQFGQNAVYAMGNLMKGIEVITNGQVAGGHSTADTVATQGGSYTIGNVPVPGGGLQTDISNQTDISKLNPIIAKETVIEMEGMNIIGLSPSVEDLKGLQVDSEDYSEDGDFDEFDAISFGSAIFSAVDARVALKNSNIQDFITGLDAQDNGTILMEGGSITKSYIGATADSGSAVLLEGVNINVERTSESIPFNVNGLRSFGDSVILMQSGSITFPVGGVGIIAEKDGFVALKGVKINIAAKEREERVTRNAEEILAIEEDASILFLLQGGTISLSDEEFEGSNAVVFWVEGSPVVDQGILNIIDIYSDSFDGASDSFRKIGVSNSLGEVVDGILADTYAKVSISLTSSKIKVEGEGAYGFYFNGEDRGLEELGEQSDSLGKTSLQVDRDAVGRHIAVLKKASLKVPSGVAIYGDSAVASIVLGEDSALSSDVLLEAKSSSDFSIFVHDSRIAGAARIDKSSNARLFLSHGSEWHVIKSKDENRERGDCTDSCISLISLEDSNIRFFSPLRNGTSGQYQTLRIGNGKGTVYTASQDSAIYFNVHLMPEDENRSSQISDRLLIHGDVSGKTTVYVEDTSDGTLTVSQAENMPYSVSLIQVFGKAEKDSFKLKTDYITREGLPYKYVLRAYGPTIPPRMQYFDKDLVKDSTEVWDFRIENQYVVPSVSSAYTAATDFQVTYPYPRRQRVLIVPSVENSVDLGEGEVNAESIILPVPNSSEGSTPVTPPRGDSFARSESSEDLYDVYYDNDYEEDDYESFEELDSFPTLSENGDGRTLTLIDGTVVPYSEDIPVLVGFYEPGNPSSTLGRSETDDAPLVAISPNRDSTESPTVPATSQSTGGESATSSNVSGESEVSEPRGRVLLTTPVRSGTSGTVASTVSSLAPSASPTVSKGVAIIERVLSAASTESMESSVSSVDGRAVSSNCDDTNKNGTIGSSTPYSCSDGKSHTIKGSTLNADGSNQYSIRANKPNTLINVEGTAIIGKVSSDGVGLNQKPVSAVLAEENAEIVLSKQSTVQSTLIGLEAQRGGKVKMTDGTINAHYAGVLVGRGSSVDLGDTKISVSGSSAVAGLVSNGGQIAMNSGSITLTNGAAVRSELQGYIKLDKVDIIVKKEQTGSNTEEVSGRAAFLLSDNSSVDFTNGNVVTDANAVWVRGDDDGAVGTGASRRKRSSDDVRSSMNRANIEFSKILVEGDRSYGIYFDRVVRQEGDTQNPNQEVISGSSVNHLGVGTSVEKGTVVKRHAVLPQEKTPIGIMGAVSLKRTAFEVPESVAIYGNNSHGRVSLESNTTLSGDTLLSAENNSNISVSVDSSMIVGGARVDKSSYAKLDFLNGSGWILKRSVHKNSSSLEATCMDSCVSSVSLVDSMIEFVSEGSGYQTLHIGSGKGRVYEARGFASIHLNARLNPHDPSDSQVTDRLLIHGDVSGKTIVHVNAVSGSAEENKNNARDAHSVSIIQVYGKAERDSFRLNGNYVALQNSPYKYTLRSYSPEMTSKQEHINQKFMKDGGKFWNFRLENQYVKSGGFSANIVPDERVVRSVVPQVPTYLILPNTLFHAGLMDINNQSKQLEIQRSTSSGMLEVRENPALYLRGYGGSYRYDSDLSALEYGYGGELDYKGVEAGVLLQTIENADIAMSFGVMGSYGKLSLQPLEVEQSLKSAFDKWTATAYGSVQHELGFYVDGLFSYGLLKGDVLTLARGKTATLKGNPLSVSLAGGQTFAMGYEGFVLDPQVQVVYQYLQFDKASDIDKFDIEMGKLDQWVARVGGRLTKNPAGSEGVNAVAFYGKLYLVHGFGGKQSVHFKDAFQLGAFGSALEAGLGFNAKLLPKFSLHGDIVYQHKLNKVGFSGASFSGGVRYQF
ncbi:outer membrane autotransporter protein [Bartonella callosciuri]|uniref:Outer membrane autotransporter protein n=1 Tax=Bartonella callosciuri TaxID=686223 RepID=A0A840NVH6_9HYPH|nr:autotransporter outer membrane beta-barrel domain-containing protein [Bartonella callosciuri]MBB5073945.1 outer membrane autotransporter protein [Bartonella callosciuri]